MIESISAVTLATHDMSRAVHFYRTVVRRLNSRASGRERAFSISLRGPRRKAGLGGRVTFCHSDADTLYAGVIAAGYRPNSAPRDDKWGERYFHLTDPDGHQPSFASPLATY
jgi:catechol 2,3-dioxygenase-like lactoylglutathione lyase family enzyme